MDNNKITVTPMAIEEAEKLGIKGWGEWSCEPSVFDWQYSDNETAYVFEGDVIVKYGAGETAHITPNTLCFFPKGLKCVWDVKKAIRKAYKFN
ncbi:MAG: cupin domain-containing protein [Oscillospiraceae bacterium]|nr:cupin domain-containing protein [Oscillospiraceae bacterium]